MRVAVCFWQKEDLIWFPLFLSPSQFVCVSPSFSLSFSPSQWESFFLCASLHQCSPLARLCASTRGRWWPCWGHETSVAMLVTMTGERKWRCLRDRWGGSHVLSLVFHLALSLSLSFIFPIGMTITLRGMIPELFAHGPEIPAWGVQFRFCG